MKNFSLVIVMSSLVCATSFANTDKLECTSIAGNSGLAVTLSASIGDNGDSQSTVTLQAGNGDEKVKQPYANSYAVALGGIDPGAETAVIAAAKSLSMKVFALSVVKTKFHTPEVAGTVDKTELKLLADPKSFKTKGGGSKFQASLETFGLDFGTAKMNCTLSK